MAISSSEKDVFAEVDGSVALIKHVEAENIFGEQIELEDVVSLLASNGIVNHVDMMAIDIAIEQSHKTGDAIEDLVAARARIRHEISFQDDTGLSSKELLEEVDSARKAYKAINEYDVEQELSSFGARFICEGTIICSIVEADQEDIYGRKIRKQNIPVKLRSGQNVSIIEKLNSVSFIAKKSGYLAIDEDMRVHVLSPFLYSEDLMSIYYVILPLKHKADYKELINYFALEYNHVVREEQACCDMSEVLERITLDKDEEGIVEHVKLAQGVMPIPGKDAEMKICIDAERDKQDGHTSIIDFMKKAYYTMVKEGELLAEMTLSVDGLPGMDVYGRLVGAERAKGRQIHIGANVKVEEDDERVLLYAKTGGCLAYNNFSISVTDTLYIKGDVGSETGDISHSNSVFVNGNILSGFSVECKNDLVVNGSIENNVNVKCGSLVVKKGVFTKKGMVYVKDEADVGYIQEAYVRVGGNLTVQRYIYGAKVHCRGDLVVLGRGVPGNQRGAVMGSVISMMGSAELDSVGNANEKTVIMCGCDMEMSNQIENAKGVILKLQSEIVAIQKSIHIDFSSANVVEMIAKYPVHRRREVACKLEDIKKILTVIDTYKEKIEKLKEKAYAKDQEKVSIKVYKFIIPKTTFVIGNTALNISSKMPGMTARLRGREVKLYSN